MPKVILGRSLQAHHMGLIYGLGPLRERLANSSLGSILYSGNKDEPEDDDEQETDQELEEGLVEILHSLIISLVYKTKTPRTGVFLFSDFPVLLTNRD